MPRLDLVAVAPELILTATICVVLLIDLALPDERKWAIMPASLAGVAATFIALLPLAGERHVTLSGMFVVDSFAVLVKGLFCVAAALVLVISHGYLQDDRIPHGEYYFLLLCSLLGMVTIASSRDLLAIFISLELVSLPTFVLAGLRKSDVKSNEAALKFFLFGIVSTAVMLFGMSLVYGVTGTTNLASIAERFATSAPDRSIAVLSIFFVVAGFGFKISAFPFQWWVPDTYEGSPVPVAAFLSVASKTAGFVGLLQILFVGFPGVADLWRPFLAIVAVLTMTFGNLVALTQRHMVRLLAYSSIGQAGYILLPLGVVSQTGGANNKPAFVASLTYLLIYAFMEIGAFSIAIVHGRRGGGYFINDFAGLFQRSPGLALAMAAFLFSLAGIPPAAGWAAKLFVFRSVISAGYPWLAAVMAINTVVALFYYVGVVWQMAKPAVEPSAPVSVPALAGAAILVSAAMVVLLGILPDLAGHLAELSTLV